MQQSTPPEPGRQHRPERAERADYDGAQPDRYACLLHVLIRERLRASAEARDTTSMLARSARLGAAGSLRIVTRQIIVAEINRDQPAASKAALNEQAMDLIRELDDQITNALTHPDMALADPVTSRPDGRTAAADRLVETITTAYLTGDEHTTRKDLNPAQVRAVAARTDLFYRVLLELAVEHLRLEQTRRTIPLLDATEQRNTWVSAARRAARENTDHAQNRTGRMEQER